MTENMGNLIGESFGQVVEVRTDEEGVGLGPCLVLQVHLDIRKPLKRKLKIKVDTEEDEWVYFKYERLPIFCYCCGILGHNDRECSIAIRLRNQSTGTFYQYGSWLKAPSKQRNIKGKSFSTGKFHSSPTSGGKPSAVNFGHTTVPEYSHQASVRENSTITPKINSLPPSIQSEKAVLTQAIQPVFEPLEIGKSSDVARGGSGGKEAVEPMMWQDGAFNQLGYSESGPSNEPTEHLGLSKPSPSKLLLSSGPGSIGISKDGANYLLPQAVDPSTFNAELHDEGADNEQHRDQGFQPHLNQSRWKRKQRVNKPVTTSEAAYSGSVQPEKRQFPVAEDGENDAILEKKRKIHGAIQFELQAAADDQHRPSP